jgi:hypothetical protein
MDEKITTQMGIVKSECFKLAQMLGWNRLELIYMKQKKFNDDGTLDLKDVFHYFSS